ncbi:MAG: hypothetical protein AABY27_03105 [Pseudomonadota bacterium]
MNNQIKYNQAELSNKLKLLSDSLLARSNKTGEYYFNFYQKSISTSATNQTIFSIANEILSSSSKIQDLAGFNYKETLILDEICIIANEIKLQNKV